MSEIKPGLHYPIRLDALPKSLEVAYVGDAASKIQPGFASGEHNTDRMGIPHLRPMNIDRQGNIDLNVLKYVSPDADSKRLKTGDVLFNNTNSPELVGKTTAIATSLDWGFSNHMTRIVFKGEVLPKFGAYQLHYLWMAGYFLHNCVRHVNQASVSSQSLAKAVPFIIAPLGDQGRIVAEIERQFSRLDEAVASLKRAKTNLKRYKAAVLKAAVDGKLTEQWRKEHPGVEPAEKLLERILTKRRKKWEESILAKIKEGAQLKGRGWKGKYKEPKSPDQNNLPPIPRGWYWASTDQLFWFVTSGSRGWAKYYSDSGPLFIRVGNLDHDSITLDMRDLQRVKQQEGAEGIRVFSVSLHEIRP